MAAANVSSILDQSKVDSKAESSAGHDHSSVKGEILSKSLPEMMIGDEKKLTSRRSVSSKGKSVKSERLMKAFQAELDVMDKEDQIEILQREHEHAIKMQKAKMELKRLRIKKQLEQKLPELDESEDDDLTETSRSSNILLPRESREESVQRFFNSQPVDDVDVKDANPVVPEVGQAKPVTQDTVTSSGMEKVAESLAHVANMIMQQNATSQQVAAASQLPKIDVPVFDGDPLRYPLWRNAFSSFVDSKPLDTATKLNLLNNHVTGEAKTVVEHYLLLGTDEAYLKARESLANRYGNTSIVSSAFMKKLNSWPRISDRNPGGLRSFADFLQQVSVAKMTVDSLGILDYPQENVKLVMKLPFYLERKWRDEVDKWQRCGYGTYPTFARFTEFVRSAAEKANIPELEHSRPDESKQKSVPSKSKTFQGRSFSTSAETNKRIEYSSCPCCKQDHHLDDCPSFQKKSYHAKKAFFFQKYLCMGCGESSSHLVKECTKKRKCKKCGEAHLTCLHREKAEQSSGSSKCTSVCSLPDQDGKDHCMIVPVWVRHADNPSREYLEYAILDDQSNVGFVSKDLCDKMEVQGQETDLMLTTIHQSTHVRCQKISGLEVLDFHKKQIIQLPPCFTREEVPAKRSQIPKADVLRRWSHLAPIADQLMPYNPAIKVSLLIGNNCPRAIRPREVIAGGEDDPYGMRTSLGWGVVGRVCQTPSQPEDGVVCHRIQVKQEYPHFVHSTKVKEVFSPETVLKIVEQDFQMTSPKGAALSVQEARFMSILEDGIRQKSDGHYEMPLPLKSDEASFPDNKILALKRWRQLSARFRKNPKFLADYRRFMNRRGAVRQLRSDQGTMFVGARSELREALAEMDQSEVQEYLLQNGCDWIPFKMNVPHASHMGGVWERQIQTVRRVLEPLMKSAGSQLDDEAFRTFMTEAEAIINSRPLTTSGLSDHETPEPLTPLHLLTMKPKVALPPPGQFQREDMYARKWWRRVQYLTNQFWLRWRREYLQQLQNRQKWVSPSRQLAVGDVVIAKENDDARGRWPLARVIEVYPSKDGLIRKVKVLMADGLLDNEGKRQRPPSELERPVHKLVLLLPAEQ
ncbi:uncharacterized protein [Diadema antillarum]|uniref:uncharacterized protein n=1 Tax=Diadema antillarum TaxID=105358 RepID=UPI003A8C4501